MTDAFLGPIYSILQGMQLALQSGRTRSDRPCSLHHASMLEEIKVTATICKLILCDKQSASCSGIDGCSEHGLSDRVLPDSSLSCIPCIIVYAHGRRLWSNWFRQGSPTISYPQCSLTFLREC